VRVPPIGSALYNLLLKEAERFPHLW